MRVESLLSYARISQVVDHFLYVMIIFIVVFIFVP